MLLVACGVGAILSGCSADPNIWDTDVEDDFTRGVYDRMDGLLWEGFSYGKGGPVATNITYL